MSLPLGPYLGVNNYPIPISNSEIQTYKDCRRKWWLAYYRGLARKKKEVLGPLPLGSRIHNALEAYYKDNLDLIQAYKDFLDEDRIKFAQSEDANDEAKEKKFNSEADLGLIMLEGYLEWLDETGSDADIEVIGVEDKISAILLDGKVELQGKVDMKVIERSSGNVLITDHKSAASFNEYYLTAHMSEQLQLYALLERIKNGGTSTVDGGMYNLLRKVKRGGSSKPPFYDRITVRFNDKQIESFWSRVNGELRDMIATREALDSGVDHQYVAYPSPTRDCTWKCPFFAACTMFDDGSDAEGWLEDFTEVSDPYARYDNNDGENE